MSTNAPRRRIIARSNEMDHSQPNWTANFIWVPSNRKSAHRKGKVQLNDATRRFRPPRKNLGNTRGAP